MATAFSLSPLFRSTIGFDRFNDLFESVLQNEETSTSYPPYNIVKRGEERYSISMAVAGFTENDLNVTVQNDQVTVSGRLQEKQQDEDGQYLYHGIATRAFERTFRLDDHLKVISAELKNGLLRIELIREVPEAQKPRMIPINGQRTMAAIEHTDNSSKEAKKKAS